MPNSPRTGDTGATADALNDRFSKGRFTEPRTRVSRFGISDVVSAGPAASIIEANTMPIAIRSPLKTLRYL